MDEVRFGDERDAFKLIVHGGVNDLLDWEAEKYLVHIFQLILFVWLGVQPVGCMVDLVLLDVKIEMVNNCQFWLYSLGWVDW